MMSAWTTQRRAIEGLPMGHCRSGVRAGGCDEDWDGRVLRVAGFVRMLDAPRGLPGPVARSNDVDRRPGAGRRRRRG